MVERFLKVALACYENDNDEVAAAAAIAAAEEAAAIAAAEEARKKDKGPKVFSQEDINRFLADDRRKHSQKFEQLEAAYKDALENQSLSKEQREQLEAKLEDLQKTFRSREQQLEHDKKQLEDKYAKEVKDWESKATTWEQKYKQTLIDRSLQDAAIINDAFNMAQIVSLLRPMTKFVEKTDDQGRATGDSVPMVDLTDIDTKTGDAIITRRTPEDAVRRMKELPTLFGNLFKSNVVSGVGAGTATGGNMSGSGRIDPTKISVEQYMKLRKDNPEALGLAKKS
jgi:DNA repair exonuclease SbcCD ATPase subunit